jgi:hypothetical protein
MRGAKTRPDRSTRYGGSICHGRVGEVISVYLWCPARSTCRLRSPAQSPFACTRSGRQLRPGKQASHRYSTANETSPTFAHRGLTQIRSKIGRNRRVPFSRITLRPHDPTTGEEIEKDEVVRGYEYERGQYVTFTPGELKALDLESSKVIDLEMFVPRGEVDPVYFNSPYYLYPDGQMARPRPSV